VGWERGGGVCDVLDIVIVVKNVGGDKRVISRTRPEVQLSENQK